MKIVKRSKL